MKFLLLCCTDVVKVLSILHSCLISLNCSVGRVNVVVNVKNAKTTFTSSFLTKLLIHGVKQCRSEVLFTVFVLLAALCFVYVS